MDVVTRSLFAFFLISFVSSKDTLTVENTQFEAAFQGRCDHDSPCEHLCYELHDGMFECDCRDGFVLHTNGYSCLLINGTSEPIIKNNISEVDDRADIIYQKDTSFSAVLDTRKEAAPVDSNAIEDAVHFITSTASTSSISISSPSAAAATSTTNSSVISTITESSTANTSNTSTFARSSSNQNLVRNSDSTTCLKNCGAGTCIVQVSDADTDSDADADDESNQRCQCVLGKSGPNCQTDVEIRIPRFSGQSWLAFPALRAAYKHIQLEIEFRPESWDGILFLTGERDDLAGDFVSVVLYEGFVEFRFDCGSGVGVVRSDETVLLNKWNKLTIYRHRWDAWIQLNKGKHIQGRSKGLFSRITFREPVFIGARGNTTVLSDKMPTDRGFKGCVRYLEINGVLYNFAASPLGDAVAGFDVEECVADRCSNIPCKHGGKCVTSDDSATCLCPLGFIGDLCETRLDLQVPMFNGSSYLKYHGLGYSSLSWLDIEMILKPLSADGVILYNGHKIDGMGDFIAIYMSTGYLNFAFDLGTGAATLRSAYPIALDEWHTLKISRTGRLAVMRVDSQPYTQVMTPGAFVQLSLNLNLYVGGVPNFDIISPKIKTTASYVGCIQKIVINEKPMHILAEALAGLNMDNCPHPCLAKPCGLYNDLQCEPLYDSYKCVCQRNCCSELSDTVSNVATFNEDTFLHYVDPELNRRIVSDRVSINMRFKTTSVMGLLLWHGNAAATSLNSNKDFLSLAIVNGYLQLSYNVGNGQVSLMYNSTRVDDGHWHRVNIFREVYVASLMVDNGEAIVSKMTGPLRQMNSDSGLYIGGLESEFMRSNFKYNKGIRGCISDFVVNSDYRVKLSWKQEDVVLCE
ncbi:pikachurin-like [Planococcus citri]|uniref:pikachurin-like n=1 Tax=Planococcus citri TaxID=170843 RepID=UPI0031F77F51